MHRLLHIILFLFTGFSAISQSISYEIKDGDTINFADAMNKKQGVWRKYYLNGKLKSEVVYKDNKKHGLDIHWYNNTSHCVKQEKYYSNGKLDGPVTYFYKNCNKQLIENYKNGIKDGLEISYHTNGQIKTDATFKNGNLEGVYRVYDKNGKFNFESRTTNEELVFEPDYEDTAYYSVYKILTRNPNWKNTVIVTDLTASMHPYAKEINCWLTLYFQKDTAQQHFVFFNDGDGKKDSEKKVGLTGGIYYCKASSTDMLVNTMKTTIKKGSGGDPPENVIEAILYGLKKVKNVSNVILIADNWAKVRDLSLTNNIKVPVRVILCGVYEGIEINSDYLNIAYKSKGSIHTIEQDITDLINQKSGKQFSVNGFDYIIRNGKIRAD
ncbi:MAG: toxin-antitoxin system YwqK family antitoxin [Bacteroidia bacterium]